MAKKKLAKFIKAILNKAKPARVKPSYEKTINTASGLKIGVKKPMPIPNEDIQPTNFMENEDQKTRTRQMRREIFEAGGDPANFNKPEDLKTIMKHQTHLNYIQRSQATMREIEGLTSLKSAPKPRPTDEIWAPRRYEENPKRLAGEALRTAVFDLLDRQSQLPTNEERASFHSAVIKPIKQAVGEHAYHEALRQGSRAIMDNKDHVTLRGIPHDELCQRMLEARDRGRANERSE